MPAAAVPAAHLLVLQQQLGVVRCVPCWPSLLQAVLQLVWCLQGAACWGAPGRLTAAPPPTHHPLPQPPRQPAGAKAALFSSGANSSPAVSKAEACQACARLPVMCRPLTGEPTVQAVHAGL
jgi:hypothetical protein